MIYLLANGNDVIGFGHIMRSIGLAKELINRGHKVTFITKYIMACGVLEKEGMNYLSVLDDMSQNDIVDKLEKDLIIVDSYENNDDLLARLKKRFCKIVIIDDLLRDYDDVDMIVNGNIYGNELLTRQGSYYLLGPLYNMQKPLFCNKDRVVNKVVKNILITTGGSDTKGLLMPMIENVVSDRNYRSIHFHMPIGPGVKNKREFELIQHKIPNLTLYVACNNLASIMKKSDLAISSGGSTLYELAASGVPAIVFEVAENQRHLIHGMVESNLVIEVPLNDRFLINLRATLDEVIEDYEWRFNTSEIGRRLFDGKGLVRIADEIEHRFSKEVRS